MGSFEAKAGYHDKSDSSALLEMSLNYFLNDASRLLTSSTLSLIPCLSTRAGIQAGLAVAEFDPKLTYF